MSVTGFRIDGSIQKYDYNALDNKPSASAGLTDAVKTAILQIARKVVYIDEHGPEYYQELYDVLYGNIVSVRNILIGCYSNNSEISIRTGTPYIATIQANPGYSLTDATVSITMGGTNVTGAYLNGTINIPNVTGDLVITVSAVSAISSISATYTQSGAVYRDDTLDDLKDDLVVTATYNNGAVQTLTSADYTLSGTLATGTSTIIVSYADKTTTFNVEVTIRPNGLADGSYSATNGYVTVSNNAITGYSIPNSFTWYGIDLQRPLSLRSGDILTFACSDVIQSSTHNTGVAFRFSSGGSEITQNAAFCPFRDPPITGKGTMNTDFVATKLYVSGASMADRTFTMHMSINGEAVF